MGLTGWSKEEVCVHVHGHLVAASRHHLRALDLAIPRGQHTFQVPEDVHYLCFLVLHLTRQQFEGQVRTEDARGVELFDVPVILKVKEGRVKAAWSEFC